VDQDCTRFGAFRSLRPGALEAILASIRVGVAGAKNRIGGRPITKVDLTGVNQG
jgi:hypothetical protein